MKAVVQTRYGPPEVLELREIPRPVPKDNEVLVKVRAATVNTGDCEIRRFEVMPLVWLPLRLLIGVRKPRGTTVLGQEVAGVVEAVGKDVSRFKPGDQIIAATGLGFGGYAEYVALPEKRTMAIKPANVSFEEASALPVGGLNALYYLKAAGIRPGRDVLIYGSTGAIGTFAVQLAKHFGANVTAVCSTGKIDLVRSLGADWIIDYTREDFTENGLSYDVIFDTIGKSSFSRSMSSVREGGVYIQANPTITDMVRGPIASRRQRKRVLLQYAGDDSEELAFLAGLLGAGEISTVIDRCYPLEQTAEAHRYVERGHKSGNVVISVEHGESAAGEETP
ncbi:MAG: NAD(P)-dependent alcohol dehydrogenase [Thermomicrobiales bacterium]